MITQIFRKWADALRHPNALFRKESAARSFSEGAVSTILSGVIVAIISLVSLNIPGGTSATTAMMTYGFAAMLSFAMIVVFPILSLVGWLIGSVILYIFAKVLGGKGTFTAQSHSLALLNSAFGVLMSLIALILTPVPLAGIAVLIIISIYNLYALTVSLRSVHRYSNAHAVLTWLIPMIIVLIIAFILAVALAALLFAGVASGAFNFTQTPAGFS